MYIHIYKANILQCPQSDFQSIVIKPIQSNFSDQTKDANNAVSQSDFDAITYNPRQARDAHVQVTIGGLSFCMEKPVVPVGQQMEQSFPVEISQKKGIPSEVFLLSRFYRNDRNITEPFASSH